MIIHAYIYIYIYKISIHAIFFFLKTKVLNTCNQESTYYINAIIIKKNQNVNLTQLKIEIHLM